MMPKVIMKKNISWIFCLLVSAFSLKAQVDSVNVQVDSVNVKTDTLNRAGEDTIMQRIVLIGDAGQLTNGTHPVVDAVKKLKGI